MRTLSADGPHSATQIYIDATPLGDPWLTGIGRYTARLALALARRARVCFFAEDFELCLPKDLDWSHDQDLQRWARRVWRARRVPLSNDPRHSVGVYTCLRPSERRFAIELSILHDFTPLVVPHMHTEATRGLWQGFFAKTLLSSDGALAVSKNTKHDAAWLCDFPQDRIAVQPSGPSLCVDAHLDRGTVTRRSNVILVVATLEPRKNAHFLLNWFRDSNALPQGCELWWVGRLGWLTSRARLDPYRRLSNRRVRFLGTVSDTKLCALYRSAAVSIYPSLYEGFGFPVLDSLRHGTPVITGYHSSLREFEHLSGVRYFDPCDAKSLDEAWLRLGTQAPHLDSPQSLDAQYHWNQVAEALLRLSAVANSKTCASHVPAWSRSQRPVRVEAS